MIETLGTFGALAAIAARVTEWLRSGPSGWTVSQDLSTGSLRGSCDDSRLGRLQVRPHFMDAALGYVVLAEGNLTSLLCGEGQKMFSLRPESVPAAVDAYLAALVEACPLASGLHREHRISRVDPSATWLLPPDRAGLVIEEARRQFNGQVSGRKKVAAYGVESVTLRITKQQGWTVYDKTRETLDRFKGSKTRPALPEGGTLVRVEGRFRKDLAREVFGDDLSVVGRKGPEMARKRIDDVTALLSSVRHAGTVSAVVSYLVISGASPGEAVRLAGPCVLLSEGGIPALRKAGISQSQAYLFRQRLRELDLVWIKTPQARDEQSRNADLYWADEQLRTEDCAWATPLDPVMTS
jgi:hypothetical protein